MTPAHSPFQELAEVIQRAADEWYDDDNTRFMELSFQDYIARAVAARLMHPETVERMADAYFKARQIGDDNPMRAAVAAVVGEDV